MTNKRIPDDATVVKDQDGVEVGKTWMGDDGYHIAFTDARPDQAITVPGPRSNGVQREGSFSTDDMIVDLEKRIAALDAELAKTSKKLHHKIMPATVRHKGSVNNG